MNHIHLSDVRFSWPKSRTAESAFSIEVPEFRLQAGEKLLLLGHSGSGKSTLLSLICGIISPQNGKIEIAGTDISSLKPAKRDQHRAEHIGVIFQQFNLLPYASVKDNIVLPLEFAPNRRKAIGDPHMEVMRLLDALKLPSRIVNETASRLSVGQQQRVAAARALIGSPPIILADEPTSSLDADAQSAFLELLLVQARAVNSSVLMVSHDPRLSDHFDRNLEIEDILAKVNT